MPKIKTHKGTAKRVKITKTGKMIHGSPNTGHFLSKKSSARKRRLSRDNKVTGSSKQNLKKRLGE